MPPAMMSIPRRESPVRMKAEARRRLPSSSVASDLPDLKRGHQDGNQPYFPCPCSANSCGLFVALSVMVSVPAALPLATGLKSTATLQRCFGASEPPTTHVLFAASTANGAVALRPLSCAGFEFFLGFTKNANFVLVLPTL
jgi:hypothetical protein